MELVNPESALTPAEPRNLPRTILLAIDAALHISNLPRRLRSTLAELGRYVSKDRPLASTVWPTKKRLAEDMGASERTVYRHLADLEAMELIIRVEAPDVRNRHRTEGYYLNGHIALTPRGAALLGLAAPVTDRGPDKMADSVTLPIKQLTEPSGSKNHPPTSLPKTVPADLVILAEQGVSTGGIFGLMGEATAKGKRISDIVVAVGERLRGMREGGLVSYLRVLIAGPTDFKHRAEETRQRQVGAEVGRALAQKAAQFRTYFAGGTLIDHQQGALYRFDREWRYVETEHSGRVIGSAPLHDLSAWIAGIESGRLVRATQLA
ncbi:MAG: hypothetical protein NVSMB6_28510 [Burkholderiaceae bacterium]